METPPALPPRYSEIPKTEHSPAPDSNVDRRSRQVFYQGPPVYNEVVSHEQNTENPFDNPYYEAPPTLDEQAEWLEQQRYLSLPSDIELPRVPTKDFLSLPIVVPQTARVKEGPWFSPFARCYVGQLADHNINKEEFVAFIDGLNEALTLHPIYRGITAAGAAMSMVYGVHPVQIPGMIIQHVAVGAGAVQSYVRVKAYMQSLNENLFHPAGLHVKIKTTKKMLAEIGYPEDKVELPSLDCFDDRASYVPMKASKAAQLAVDRATQGDGLLHDDDPRVRWVRALDGYCMPLDFDVPARVEPTTMLKKMSAAQSAREGRVQQRQMMKKRYKSMNNYFEKVDKAEQKRLEGDNEIAKLQQQLGFEEQKMQRSIMTLSGSKRDKVIAEFEKKRTKLVDQIAKETQKRDEAVDKEMTSAWRSRKRHERSEGKVANGVRWLVIAKHVESDDKEEDVDTEDDDDLDSVAEVNLAATQKLQQLQIE